MSPAPPPAPWQYTPQAPPAWRPSAVPSWQPPGRQSGKPARPRPPRPSPPSQPSRPEGQERPDPARPGSFRAGVVKSLNQERRRAGCPAVHPRRALSEAAQDHSAFMARAQRLSHTGRSGSDPGRRITAAGYRFDRVDEAILAGPETPEAAVRAWMNSPPHRRSLLTCAFRHVGVGRSGGAHGPWWDLLLAAPR
ncbi:CAP domain-containing protein [Streptomyces sp. URMC 127]|uniref:CAP domain-containing protein n=1 Tax=Streptomyces sp. URMC 127 TaxID=3423402 RepID=UPI003F1C20ED